MELTYVDDNVRVYDDVLPSDKYAAVWRFMRVAAYESVHASGWEKVWRLHEGAPMRGHTVMSAPAVPSSVEAPAGKAARADTDDAHVYPTHSTVDVVIDHLLAGAGQWQSMFGKQGEDWIALTATPFLYSVHDGLSWHVDAGRYRGAYTFYSMPEWNCQWGGELLVGERVDEKQMVEQVKVVDIADGELRRVSTLGVDGALDNSLESSTLMASGMGRYIAPKPNRLVLLAPGVPHRIHPVQPAAGDRVRASISGFFLAADHWRLRDAD